jgi:nitroreductase
MPNPIETFPLPTHRDELIAFLETRRSNLAKVMTGPGPDPKTRDKILEIGARVPDHRKLAPWRFVLFEGQARSDFGQHIASAFMAQNREAPADRAIFEGARLTRAPLVVAVISSPTDCPRGTPKWEQELSSGAVCFNLCLAAQAHGFGAQWLTEWYAYDAAVNAALGLSEGERVSGFIYIGTPTAQSSPRARPPLETVTRHWGTSS